MAASEIPCHDYPVAGLNVNVQSTLSTPSDTSGVEDTSLLCSENMPREEEIFAKFECIHKLKLRANSSLKRSGKRCVLEPVEFFAHENQSDNTGRLHSDKLASPLSENTKPCDSYQGNSSHHQGVDTSARESFHVEDPNEHGDNCSNSSVHDKGDNPSAEVCATANKNCGFEKDGHEVSTSLPSLNSSKPSQSTQTDSSCSSIQIDPSMESELDKRPGSQESVISSHLLVSVTNHNSQSTITSTDGSSTTTSITSNDSLKLHETSPPQEATVQNLPVAHKPFVQLDKCPTSREYEQRSNDEYRISNMAESAAHQSRNLSNQSDDNVRYVTLDHHPHLVNRPVIPVSNNPKSARTNDDKMVAGLSSQLTSSVSEYTAPVEDTMSRTQSSDALPGNQHELASENPELVSLLTQGTSKNNTKNLENSAVIKNGQPKHAIAQCSLHGPQNSVFKLLPAFGNLPSIRPALQTPQRRQMLSSFDHQIGQLRVFAPVLFGPENNHYSLNGATNRFHRNSIANLSNKSLLPYTSSQSNSGTAGAMTCMPFNKYNEEFVESVNAPDPHRTVESNFVRVPEIASQAHQHEQDEISVSMQKSAISSQSETNKVISVTNHGSQNTLTSMGSSSSSTSLTSNDSSKFYKIIPLNEAAVQNLPSAPKPFVQLEKCPSTQECQQRSGNQYRMGNMEAAHQSRNLTNQNNSNATYVILDHHHHHVDGREERRKPINQCGIPVFTENFTKPVCDIPKSTGTNDNKMAAGLGSQLMSNVLESTAPMKDTISQTQSSNVLPGNQHELASHDPEFYPSGSEHEVVSRPGQEVSENTRNSGSSAAINDGQLKHAIDQYSFQGTQNSPVPLFRKDSLASSSSQAPQRQQMSNSFNHQVGQLEVVAPLLCGQKNNDCSSNSDTNKLHENPTANSPNKISLPYSRSQSNSGTVEAPTAMACNEECNEEFVESAIAPDPRRTAGNNVVLPPVIASKTCQNQHTVSSTPAIRMTGTRNYTPQLLNEGNFRRWQFHGNRFQRWQCMPANSVVYSPKNQEVQIGTGSHFSGTIHQTSRTENIPVNNQPRPSQNPVQQIRNAKPQTAGFIRIIGKKQGHIIPVRQYANERVNAGFSLTLRPRFTNPDLGRRSSEATLENNKYANQSISEKPSTNENNPADAPPAKTSSFNYEPARGVVSQSSTLPRNTNFQRYPDVTTNYRPPVAGDHGRDAVDDKNGKHDDFNAANVIPSRQLTSGQGPQQMMTLPSSRFLPPHAPPQPNQASVNGCNENSFTTLPVHQQSQSSYTPSMNPSPVDHILSSGVEGTVGPGNKDVHKTKGDCQTQDGSNIRQESPLLSMKIPCTLPSMELHEYHRLLQPNLHRSNAFSHAKAAPKKRKRKRGRTKPAQNNVVDNQNTFWSDEQHGDQSSWVQHSSYLPLPEIPDQQEDSENCRATSTTIVTMEDLDPAVVSDPFAKNVQTGNTETNGQTEETLQGGDGGERAAPFVKIETSSCRISESEDTPHIAAAGANVQNSKRSQMENDSSTFSPLYHEKNNPSSVKLNVRRPRKSDHRDRAKRRGIIVSESSESEEYDSDWSAKRVRTKKRKRILSMNSSDDDLLSDEAIDGTEDDFRTFDMDKIKNCQVRLQRLDSLGPKIVEDLETSNSATESEHSSFDGGLRKGEYPAMSNPNKSQCNGESDDGSVYFVDDSDNSDADASSTEDLKESCDGDSTFKNEIPNEVSKDRNLFETMDKEYDAKTSPQRLPSFLDVLATDRPEIQLTSTLKMRNRWSRISIERRRTKKYKRLLDELIQLTCQEYSSDAIKEYAATDWNVQDCENDVSSADNQNKLLFGASRTRGFIDVLRSRYHKMLHSTKVSFDETVTGGIQQQLH